MVSLMRQGGIQYYDNCQLLHFPKRPEWDKPEAFFLVLTGRREASKDYRQVFACSSRTRTAAGFEGIEHCRFLKSGNENIFLDS